MRMKAPTSKSVELAKLAIFWDDDLGAEYRRLFPYDNDPDNFRGTKEELSEIRDAMKRYEEQEAEMMEDKAFYDARFELQHVEVEE